MLPNLQCELHAQLQFHRPLPILNMQCAKTVLGPCHLPL